jgi:CcmD family protein
MIEARNFEFLFFGLAAAWLIVIGYIFYLVRRSSKLESELSRVKSMMTSGENNKP